MKIAHTLFACFTCATSLTFSGCGGSDAGADPTVLNTSAYLPIDSPPQEVFGSFLFGTAHFGFDQEFLNQDAGAMIQVNPAIVNSTPGGDFIPYMDGRPDPEGQIGIPHNVNSDTDERAARDQDGVYQFPGFLNGPPDNSWEPGQSPDNENIVGPPGTGQNDGTIGNLGYWTNRIAYTPGSSTATLELEYTLNGYYRVEFQQGIWGSHWVIFGAPYTIRRTYTLMFKGVNEAGEYYGSYTCKLTYMRSWRHNPTSGVNMSGQTVSTTPSGTFTFTPGAN
ncbi:hypothetical protein ICN84_10665 [Akkermansia glycaniphila]|uniref:hypothetical protein n=1 Tax=Akkermansia glycaniphila TaxID=1679444 RepID=UPI001C016895|nr:hypothetical protein [Akkermansia glycaniphila]MBT9450528.1 hypothetical protein [Akkermansia glycaniphila]